MARQSQSAHRAEEADAAPTHRHRGHDRARALPPHLAALQASAGNRAVARLLEAPAPGRVQRRVFIGSTELTSTTPKQRRRGRGEHRNIGEMIDDVANHYFKDEAEMEAYAAGRTENIGYLEKQQAWIRIHPKRVTVLGESHSKTTLVDVANAVGTRRYRYEGFNDMPAPLLARSKRMRQTKKSRDAALAAKVGTGRDSRNHAGEELMPKIVVGVVGLKSAVDQAVKAHQAGKAASAAAAESGYTRRDAEMRMLSLGVLTAAKSAKYNITPQPLWTAHQEVLNTTAKQLGSGQPLQSTALVAAIAAGRFTFEDLVDSFKAAARQALREAGLDTEFDEFATQWNTEQATEDPDAPEFERMREFSMVKKVEEAASSGDLLFGMGDVHRGHVEKILTGMGFYVRSIAGEVQGMKSSFPTFVAEQKRLYPQ